MSKVTEYRLKRTTQVLARAFNAARVNIDSDDDLVSFKDKFDALGCATFAKVLGVNDRDSFAIDWMMFSNQCLFGVGEY